MFNNIMGLSVKLDEIISYPKTPQNEGINSIIKGKHYLDFYIAFIQLNK